MGVWCQILVRKPSDGVHFPGTVIRGIVKYATDQPTEFKDIRVSLVGSGWCQWTETVRRKNERERRTYTGTEEYVALHRSLIEKRVDGIIRLQPENYETPFEFLLPYNIPSSYKDRMSAIKYEIKVKFVTKEMLKFNKEFKKQFPVSGYIAAPVIEERTVFVIEKKLFKLFSTKNYNNITLQGDINTTFFHPNQTAALNFVVTNESKVELKSVKTELIKKTIYTDNFGRMTWQVKVMPSTESETPSVPKNAIANMTASVPIPLDLYSIKNSKIISVEYAVKVILRLPVPYKNEIFEIPIDIGYKYEPSVVVVTDIPGDEPPTYWEAIGEDIDDDKDIDNTNGASGSKDGKHGMDLEES